MQPQIISVEVWHLQFSLIIITEEAQREAYFLTGISQFLHPYCGCQCHSAHGQKYTGTRMAIEVKVAL